MGLSFRPRPGPIKQSMEPRPFHLQRGPNVLSGDVRGPASATDCPALVLIPDILLSRSHGFYPFVAESWASTRRVVTYDASCSGYCDGGAAIDAALARTYRLSTEIEDIVGLVRALGDGTIAGGWDRTRLALVGHGKGAALALHADRRLRAEGRSSPTALVLIAPPMTLVREGRTESDASSGVLVPTDADPDGVRLGAEFLEDARRLSEFASIPELLSTTPAPVLIVAGEEDAVFAPSEAEALLASGSVHKDRLVVVEKAGHNFTAGPRLTEPTVALAYLRDVVHRFLREAETAG